MTLVVDVANETGDRVPLSRARVGELARTALRAEGVRNALLSVTFLSPRRIASLNRGHLRRRGATDVIAFGFQRVGAQAPVIGDIYIAPGVARANAKRLGIPLREELARLVIHGTLHVLGHDHPDGADRARSAMWRAQERLLARSGHAPRRTGARSRS
ncbi:MAG TPA: rRNA maturation RNase YbeY [Gemmatimonadaceae bacterium]|jgi:probable rRNA maturation factor|nr:rRNA maturation RNase YbeY [Gemmatimonadaceae bacterium]